MNHSVAPLHRTLAPPRGEPVQRALRRVRRNIGKLPALLLLLFWTFLVAFPLWVLVATAVKSLPEALNNALGWPRQIQWSNFVAAWDVANLGQAFLNSFIVTICSVACLVVFGSMAAYPLARRKGIWSRRAYLYFVSGFVIPGVLNLVALYREMGAFQLLDTRTGIIVLSVAGNLPFVIFLYTGFIQSVSRELEEAATIDGAGPFRTFWSIVFPLLKPVTASVVIVTSLSVWNDFFTPLLFLQSDEKRTIPVAIFNFVGQYNDDWTHIFAAVVLSSLPIIVVYLLLQQYFIKGITGGALKG